MVKVTSLCTDCVQIITNPLCPNCFVKHVHYWLRDKNLSEKEMKAVKADLVIAISEAEESPADVKCIVCGEEKVNLCTYCVTNKIRRILEKSIRNKGVLDEFEEDFNTIIWRI